MRMLRAPKPQLIKVKYKNSFLFLSLLLLGLILTYPLQANAKSNPKYASIVIDADTGLVLHEAYADKILHPASLAKMMTLLLTFEAIEKGQIRRSDRIYISHYAASMVPSKLGLDAGSMIRVEDAIYALVTKSANDIAVALAEKISGSEKRFAIEMTTRAKQLGMKNTFFMNASGLHSKYQVTTARDMALLSQHLINNLPKYYHYFSTKSFTYRGNTYSNHNRLMNSYDGMDGLKTGYINASGFNLAASAVRNNQRIIGVVFGGRTGRSRNAHMKVLLDRGFSKLNRILVAAKNAPIPKKKPYLMLASLDQIEPASGLQVGKTLLPEKNTSKSTSDFKPQSFSDLMGQGDIDPALAKRYEAGMISIAALKKHPHPKTLEKAKKTRPSYKTQPLIPAKFKDDIGWSIQIGAFTSKDKTKTAIIRALKKLPEGFTKASAAIVPLKTKEGRLLYRGRLKGLTKEQAIQACQYLRDCLLISPHTY